MSASSDGPVRSVCHCFDDLSLTGRVCLCNAMLFTFQGTAWVPEVHYFDITSPAVPSTFHCHTLTRSAACVLNINVFACPHPFLPHLDCLYPFVQQELPRLTYYFQCGTEISSTPSLPPAAPARCAIINRLYTQHDTTPSRKAYTKISGPHLPFYTNCPRLSRSRPRRLPNVPRSQCGSEIVVPAFDSRSSHRAGRCLARAVTSSPGSRKH